MKHYIETKEKCSGRFIKRRSKDGTFTIYKCIAYFTASSHSFSISLIFRQLTRMHIVSISFQTSCFLRDSIFKIFGKIETYLMSVSMNFVL